jgi:hypothetical protein
LFAACLKSCPSSYARANAPELVDVLGTWMLLTLDGNAARATRALYEMCSDAWRFAEPQSRGYRG